MYNLRLFTLSQWLILVDSPMFLFLDTGCDANRCANLEADHMIVSDGFADTSSGNTEEILCEVGFTFDDGSDEFEVTCTNVMGTAQWVGPGGTAEEVPTCEGVLYYDSLV